jgi:hypothetical protein
MSPKWGQFVRATRRPATWHPRWGGWCGPEAHVRAESTTLFL